VCLIKNSRLTLTLGGGILAALAIVAVLAVNVPVQEEIESNLYVYPLSIGGKTYTVSVLTDWSSEPKVYLPEYDPLKYFSIDFIGSDRKQSYFNVTYPEHLVSGTPTVIWKYYEQGNDRYTLSNNGTHHSVYMIFNHTAINEHFEIRGAETG
jgi:hypothetical protein